MIENKLAELEREIENIKRVKNTADLQYHRFIKFIGICGLTLLLSAFFLSIFGYIDFTYVNSFEFHWVVEYVLSFGMMYVNVVLYVYSSSRLSINIAFKYSLLYVPVYIFSCLIPPQYILISTAIIPNLFVLLIKIGVKTISIKKLIITNLIVVLFQLAFGLVKINNFVYDYNNINVLTSLILYIDTMLFYIYVGKLVRSYVWMGLDTDKKCLVFRKTESVQQVQDKSKDTVDDSDLNARQKAFFALMVVGYQIFQLLVVLAIGLINNMFIELLLMLPMFWIGRNLLKTSWHSDKLWLCSVATFGGFYILTKVTPPIEISLFVIVGLTALFVYILHVLGIKADRLEELEQRYDTDYTKYGLSAEMAKFAYDWKVTGLRDKELMIKYEINSKSTLDSRKRFIKNKILTNQR